ERPIGKLAGVRHSKALWFQDDAQRLCAVVGILDFSAGGLSGAFHDVFVNQRLDRLCENRCGREQKKKTYGPESTSPGPLSERQRKNWLSRPSRLRCGLRLDVKRADVSIRGQLRNHGRVNLVGQRIRPAAGLVRASDGNGRTNLQSGGRGVERADGGQSTIRASAT